MYLVFKVRFLKGNIRFNSEALSTQKPVKLIVKRKDQIAEVKNFIYIGLNSSDLWQY